ncbi:hypothetical protein TWF694_008099 [Orbilia ellipsospora]|uniref:Protein kinase domain-containing protein n=1 Tax=Orbilia ellipsospora TaxID=2528407 RepID=A0AAV9XF50_9PEZI
MIPLSSHSSNISRAVENLAKQSSLIAYRNVLSYVAALGLQVFPATALDEDSWKPIGAGSYSTTFRGVLHQHGKTLTVAIKQPNGSFSRDKPEVELRVQHVALSSMIQELRILADQKLKTHPNLPHILGVYFQEDKLVPGIRPCLLFEIAVSDFQDFLDTHWREKRPAIELVNACSQISNGLCALHAHGLVHGDIKPENILMFFRDGENVATVADLGTCGLEGQSDDIVGTPAFWAPEVHSRSIFKNFVNRQSRDVYSFGLVAFAAATQYRELPFSGINTTQFSLQHEDEACLEFLVSKMPQESPFEETLQKVVQMCVRADPSQRPSIFEVYRLLETTLGRTTELDRLKDIAETALISNPNSPRVNILEQMALPDYLRSKLRAEFIALAQENVSIRTAFIISAFYGGILGPEIQKPWDLIAKVQWVLKAVELGSYPAASAIVTDKDAINVLEIFGLRVLGLRRPFFESPEVDTEKVRFRFNEYGKMGDTDITSKVIPLINKDATVGDEVDGSRNDCELTESTAEVGSLVSPSCPERDAFMDTFTLTRGSDLYFLDSDALDSSFRDAEDIVKSVHNNDLENFIILAREKSLSRGSEKLNYYASVAVYNGCFEVVSFLTEEFGEGPNESWQGATHLEDSSLFGQTRITRYYLDKGPNLMPDDAKKLSLLHYICLHDDVESGRLICQRLGSEGKLREALTWMSTEGTGSPLRFAIDNLAWKLARLYMELGAGFDSMDEKSQVLNMVVEQRSPATPIEILRSVLLYGADPNKIMPGQRPALYWPVRTSNVLAVQELLLQGADPVLGPELDFVELAKEVLHQRQKEPPINVVDEDRNIVEDSWTNAIEASNIVIKIIAHRGLGETGYDTQIQALVESADKACLDKYWIAGKELGNGAIEVKVPLV